VSGIDLILDLIDFERRLDGADLVVTAEGRFDEQSLHDKGPYGVARRASRHGVPAVVLAGSVSSELPERAWSHVVATFPIVAGPSTLEHAMQHGADALERTAEQVVRLFVRAQKS
jgi:glycerate kinase